VDTNAVWGGPIQLAMDSTINVTGSSWSSPTTLTITNTISGPGRLIKDGGGRLVFSGGAGNTYSGGTWLRDGYFDLWKSNGVSSIPGNVVVGDGDAGKSPDLHLGSANQIANGFDVTMTNGMFDVNVFAETIGTLNGRGAVVLGPGGTLNISPGTGVTCSFAGGFSGFGNFNKSGNGVLLLTGTNTHTGATTVTAGTLQVDGEIRGSAITLTGGRLQGSGKVAHIIPNGAGCLITPGTSPGILTCSNFNAAGTGSGFLLVELAGPAPGTGYDRLDVRGTVNLTGITLVGALGFASSLSNQFLIIANDGADPVAGTFTGWPQNSLLTFNGEQFRISYSGGDGNDVVLTQVSANSRPRLAIQRLSATNVWLLWPTNNTTGFTLQFSSGPGSSSWGDIPVPAVVIGTNFVVTNALSSQPRFFRLMKP
jgi:autotransporter-associated beta strand protein